jgi:outer membrane protein assembly factor BamE (lipoprotein component of BamABCDE complex)
LNIAQEEFVLKRLATVAIAVAAALAGCAAPTQPTEATAKDQLTTGQVQLTLKKNQTTQEEVLKSFGAPNLVTTNGQGEEVWTYQRNATGVNAKTSGSKPRTKNRFMKRKFM